MIASSKIKTPTMDVPVFVHPDCISQAQQLQKQLSKVYLSTVSIIKLKLKFVTKSRKTVYTFFHYIYYSKISNITFST